MSNHAPKVDLVSKLIFLVSLVAIVLAVYVLVTSLINTIQRNTTKGEIIPTSHISSASDNLKPIGVAATSDAAPAPAASVAARSGKEVFTAVCSACHKTGVAGAPIFGDKAAWEPRAATGLDALMTSALNGKGAMPARGGNPAVTDEEIKATILYMTKEAGFDLGSATPTESKAPVAEPAKKEEIAAKVTPKKVVETATKIVVPPTKPMAPTQPAAPVVTKTVTEKVAVVEKAVPAVAEAAPAAKLDGASVYTAKGCTACHGADAKTPIMSLYPKLAGQGKTYLKQQLTDIKSGKRNNGQTAVMKGIMAGVSEDEIAVLADYLSTL